MRMVAGNVIIYYLHDTLTPSYVRAASYGTQNSSGALVPQIGDVIEDFHGWDVKGECYEPITVKVVHVIELTPGFERKAFEVRVQTVR